MSNPTKALTDKQVAALKPKPEAYRVTDAAGLFLMVLPTGGKVWRTIYSRDGKRFLLKLGEYPAMSLAQARLARQRVRLDVQDGHHVAAERTTAKRERLEAGEQTVEAMTRQWHAANARDRWSANYARQMMQRLEVHAFPAIGAKPIAAVTRPDIIALLERCKARSGAFQADHVRQHLVKAFDDWLDRELIEANPADRLAGRTATPDKQPQPAVLTIEAAREVLAKVEASDASVSMKLFHRFLALTGLRSTEVREAQWAEFHGDTWRIPAGRMKGRRGRKKGHTCFLSPAALEVVDVARALAPAGAVFVFPTANYGHHRHEPFARSSLAETMKRSLGRRVHVAHGWRATMATVLRTRHPEAKDLVQVMLAHQTKEAVARLYDRTDEMMFEPKLRPLACEWAALLLDGAPSAWTLAGLPARPAGNAIELASRRVA
jgi:integrase